MTIAELASRIDQRVRVARDEIARLQDAREALTAAPATAAPHRVVTPPSANGRRALRARRCAQSARLRPLLQARGRRGPSARTRRRPAHPHLTSSLARGKALLGPSRGRLPWHSFLLNSIERRLVRGDRRLAEAGAGLARGERRLVGLDSRGRPGVIRGRRLRRGWRLGPSRSADS